MGEAKGGCDMERRRTSFLCAVSLLLTLLLALGACGSGATTSVGGSHGGASGTATAATTATTATTATATTGTSGHTTTATKSATATKTSASGSPFVGGPYADFIKRYGQPSSIGANGRALFRASSAPPVLLGVSPTSGIVRYAGADGPGNWSIQDAFAFCAKFLPKGATEYRSDSGHKYYHSGVGDLHLDAPSAGAGTSGTGAGTCSLTLANAP
jgi:hypothetical protein